MASQCDTLKTFAESVMQKMPDSFWDGLPSETHSTLIEHARKKCAAKCEPDQCAYLYSVAINDVVTNEDLKEKLMLALHVMRHFRFRTIVTVPYDVKLMLNPALWKVVTDPGGFVDRRIP